ncbi:MAG: hypothetical protein OXB95_14010, partial [Rhodobacteraceae bacterium]|nr:hypothetical protein [Paracoccaceae bacterium]
MDPLFASQPRSDRAGGVRTRQTVAESQLETAHVCRRTPQTGLDVLTAGTISDYTEARKMLEDSGKEVLCLSLSALARPNSRLARSRTSA